MKIVLIGANGAIGRCVGAVLSAKNHQVVGVGKKSGDRQVDFSDPQSLAALYKTLAPFDAVAIAAGDVAFAPLGDITAANWQLSLNSKFLGQINAVQQGLALMTDSGSFTLISGSLSHDPMKAAVIGSTINRAIEAFVQSAACEMPRGIRINVVSPSLLVESVPAYGDFFPGVPPVAGEQVAMAYLKSIAGVQTGRVYTVT